MNLTPFRITPHCERISAKDRFKIYLGALLHPTQTRRWMSFVSAHPVLMSAVRQHPKLLSKIYRPYFSRRLGCARRVELLMDHYGFLLEQGLESVLARAARENLVLCELSGKSGATFQVELSAVHEGHREGDLCLRLMLDGEMVFSASFVFMRRQGQPCVAIGRLQGGRSEGSRELVRRATKDFYGCRPGVVLVQAVRQIGASLGCERLILISNRERVALNPWRRRKISSNYDALWSEIGARPSDCGNFELRCDEAPQPVLEEVPARKRTEVKRKFAMLDAMYVGLQLQLAVWVGDLAVVQTFSPL